MKIKLTEQKLQQIVLEATKRVLAETTPQLAAAAYKKACDNSFNAKNPAEKEKFDRQSEFFKDQLSSKLQKKYSSSNDTDWQNFYGGYNPQKHSAWAEIENPSTSAKLGQEGAISNFNSNGMNNVYHVDSEDIDFKNMSRKGLRNFTNARKELDGYMDAVNKDRDEWTAEMQRNSRNRGGNVYL